MCHMTQEQYSVPHRWHVTDPFVQQISISTAQFQLRFGVSIPIMTVTGMKRDHDIWMRIRPEKS